MANEDHSFELSGFAESELGKPAGACLYFLCRIGSYAPRYTDMKQRL